MKLQTLTLCIGFALIANPVMARDFKMTWSGVSGENSDADRNGDMESGGYSIMSGNGTLGRATTYASFDGGTWDGSTFCAFNENGQPEGILLYSVDSTEVARAANGDLLYRKQASSPPSTVCFNFITSTAVVESYYDIIGGTGRFEGANGNTMLNITVDVLDGINGASGTETGTIITQ